ncbi:MAG: FkbM family methyltransferase [Calothrix sp. MO_192.B10]|nr:FkbM family methyltransferase [Calothrix sp. MO_192.B10]
MNYRYIVGKTLSQVGNTILSSKLMPLTRIVPHGISYPYDIKRIYKKKIKTIFDVGANIGQTSRFLNLHFPEADIFAFEPVHETFKTLKNNTKCFSNIKCFHSALGSQEGEKLIDIRENSELNTLIDSESKMLSNSEKKETVKITTVDAIAKKNQLSKIDILKMDVQGYESEVIQGADFYIKNNLIDFIYSEIDFDENNSECQYFGELNKFLALNNFRFSGFYEIFRWGEDKRYFGFCNALFVNCNL